MPHRTTMVKAEVFGIWLAVAILFHVSITIMLQQPPAQATAVDAKAALKQNRDHEIIPGSSASVVREWLDGVHSGYGVKFTPALEDYGVEELKDLVELATTDRNELGKILTDAGAKKMQIRNIYKGIALLTSSGPTPSR